ncbi:MAG: amidohydrolase family protein [bacterium]
MSAREIFGIFFAGLLLTATAWVVTTEWQAAAEDKSSDKGYIDVNLHLLGSAAPGILPGAGQGGPGKSPGGPPQGGMRPGRPGGPAGPGGPGRRPGPGGGPQGGMMGNQPGAGQQKKGGTTRENFISAGKKLLKLMDRQGVQKSVLLPPPRTSQNMDPVEVPALAELARMYPDRFVLCAGGDVLNPIIHDTKPSEVTDEVRAKFETEAEKLIGMGIKCFGEIAALHVSFSSAHVYEETPPDHPLFLLLADIAARHDIPIDFHMEAVLEDVETPRGLTIISSNNPKTMKANIAGFERLLAHNRNARILWRHAGWDNTGDKTPELIGRLLAAHPNLYIALRVEERTRDAAGAPMPNRVVNDNWRIRPEWMELFNSFPDRFTIGSDEFITIEGDATQMPQSFEETWRIMDQLPPDLAVKIGRENAVRIYNLQ